MDTIPYIKARSELRTGQLFFTSSDTVFSRLIKRFTNCEWSHVGIIWRPMPEDRVLAIEAIEGVGVRVTPLSRYAFNPETRKNIPMRFAVAELVDATDDHFAKAVRYALDHVGSMYDRSQIIKIAAVLGGLRSVDVGDSLTDDQFICSELVDRAFKAAGFPIQILAGGTQIPFVVPSHIADSAGKKWKFRIDLPNLE